MSFAVLLNTAIPMGKNLIGADLFIIENCIMLNATTNCSATY
jgi:hypothetical protein